MAYGSLHGFCSKNFRRWDWGQGKQLLAKEAHGGKGEGLVGHLAPWIFVPQPEPRHMKYNAKLMERSHSLGGGALRLTWAASPGVA